MRRTTDHLAVYTDGIRAGNPQAGEWAPFGRCGFTAATGLERSLTAEVQHGDAWLATIVPGFAAAAAADSGEEEGTPSALVTAAVDAASTQNHFELAALAAALPAGGGAPAEAARLFTAAAAARRPPPPAASAAYFLAALLRAPAAAAAEEVEEEDEEEGRSPFLMVAADGGFDGEGAAWRVGVCVLLAAAERVPEEDAARLLLHRCLAEGGGGDGGGGVAGLCAGVLELLLPRLPVAVSAALMLALAARVLADGGGTSGGGGTDQARLRRAFCRVCAGERGAGVVDCVARRLLYPFRSAVDEDGGGVDERRLWDLLVCDPALTANEAAAVASPALRMLQRCSGGASRRRCGASEAASAEAWRAAGLLRGLREGVWRGGCGGGGGGGGGEGVVVCSAGLALVPRVLFGPLVPHVAALVAGWGCSEVWTAAGFAPPHVLLGGRCCRGGGRAAALAAVHAAVLRTTPWTQALRGAAAWVLADAGACGCPVEERAAQAARVLAAYGCGGAAAAEAVVGEVERHAAAAAGGGEADAALFLTELMCVRAVDALALARAVADAKKGGAAVREEEEEDEEGCGPVGKAFALVHHPLVAHVAAARRAPLPPLHDPTPFTHPGAYLAADVAAEEDDDDEDKEDGGEEAAFFCAEAAGGGNGGGGAATAPLSLRLLASYRRVWAGGADEGSGELRFLLAATQAREAFTALQRFVAAEAVEGLLP